MDGSTLDLMLDREVGALESNASARGWGFSRPSPRVLYLDLPAKGGERLYLHIDLDDYPATPPAWHWRDPATGALGQPAHTPRGGGFFHGRGVICAPWNRLAYRQVDARGPHSDWTLSSWPMNPHTGGTRTLSAMALRILHELTISYVGRMG